MAPSLPAESALSLLKTASASFSTMNRIDESSSSNGNSSKGTRRSLRIRNLSIRPKYAEDDGDDDDDDDKELYNDIDAAMRMNDIDMTMNLGIGIDTATATGMAIKASIQGGVDDDDDVDYDSEYSDEDEQHQHRRSKRARVDIDNGNTSSHKSSTVTAQTEDWHDFFTKTRQDETKQTSNVSFPLHDHDHDLLNDYDVNFKMPIDDLCGGIVQNIYSYFDHPRDLFNFSHCNKRLRSLVTYEHVVQAAVYENHKRSSYQYKKAIDRVLYALEKKSVYVPSVQRLLRLVNGLRCERGKDCWSYNLLTGTVPEASNLGDFGLCICYKCSEGLTSKWRYDWQSEWLKKKLVKLSFMANCPETFDTLVTEHGTGNPVGPYCCTREIRQMTATFHNNFRRVLPDDTVVTELELKERQKEVDETLKEHVEARLCTDDNLAKWEDLVSLIRRTQREARAYKERRKQEALAAERCKYEKKVSALKKAHRELSDILLLDNLPRKQIALEHKVNHFHRPLSQPLVYSCFFVKDVMRSIINRPAFATARNLTKKATQIHDFFDLFYQSNFLSFDFLPHPGNDDCERAIRRYAKTQLTDRKVLHCTFSQPQKFTTLISEGSTSDGGGDPDRHVEAFVYMLVQNIATIGIEAFSHSVDPIDHTIFTTEDSRAYAIRFWTNAMSTRASYLSRLWTFGDETLEQLKETYDRFMESFNDQKERVERFLNRETTRAYLAGIDEHDPGHGLTRTEVLRKVLLTHPDNAEALMMEVHEDYFFENPDNWGGADLDAMLLV